MARKNKNLASFDELASTAVLKEVDPQTDVNVNVNNDANIDINNSINNDKKKKDNPNIIDNSNVNDNAAVIVNVDQKQEEDYLDKLIGSNEKKKSNSESVVVGIHLQKDLSDILAKLAKKGGRGAKSKIVNEVLRAAFKEKGLL